MTKTITTILLSSVFLFSCLTEKKVNQWNDAHETKAAKYCSIKFPVDTVSKTEYKYIDSSGYIEAYDSISAYAGSLLYDLDNATRVDSSYMNMLCNGYKPYRPNIDSLRSAIDKEIRKRLKPCIDSVVYVQSTVIDHARETVMQGQLYDKDKLIGEKDKLITGLQKDVQGGRRWLWYFIELIVLIAAYVFLKIRFKIPL